RSPPPRAGPKASWGGSRSRESPSSKPSEALPVSDRLRPIWERKRPTGSRFAPRIANDRTRRAGGSGMDRRTFLAGTGAVLFAAPLVTEAQQGGKTWQIGFLTGGGRPPDGAPPLALRQALQELGYVE